MGVEEWAMKREAASFEHLELAMTAAKRVVDETILSGLVSFYCAENEDHGVYAVWSSTTDEQIAAVILETMG